MCVYVCGCLFVCVCVPSFSDSLMEIEQYTSGNQINGNTEDRDTRSKEFYILLWEHDNL